MAGYDYDGSSELIVLCPTRENPEGAFEMVQSVYETQHRLGTEIILVVDEDDPSLAHYRAIPTRVRHAMVAGHYLRPDPPRIMVVEGGSLTKATNEAVERIWDSDAIVGHVGDDHRFITPGWDNAIRDVLLAEPGVAYAFDGFRSAWASAWWTNMVVIRTLGWLALPGSMHLTIDDAFMDIGAGLGRLHFLEDILIEHLHPAGGKVPWRPIVKGHYEDSKRLKEQANLRRYRETQFADDIAKLRDALGLPHRVVHDLAPGVTFRLKMRGKWLPHAVGPTAKLLPTPPLEELEAINGGPLRRKADRMRAVNTWHRQWRAENPGWRKAL
jgi:hypothetical protein